MEKTTGVRREEILMEGDGEKHRKETEELACHPVVHYLGLCLTCNHALRCTFTRRPDSPVLYCEEFDVSTTSNVHDPRPVERQSLGQIQNYPEGLLGLCSNCEKRSTCYLPKAEGGIWHCEEYV